MFFRKKSGENAASASIYGCGGAPATFAGKGGEPFVLPPFDDRDIASRIAARAALVSEKISQGELDSYSVPLIIAAFSPLLGELNAELDAYKIQCQIKLRELEASLQDEAKTRERILEEVSRQMNPEGHTEAS